MPYDAPRSHREEREDIAAALDVLTSGHATDGMRRLAESVVRRSLIAMGADNSADQILVENIRTNAEQQDAELHDAARRFLEEAQRAAEERLW